MTEDFLLKFFERDVHRQMRIEGNALRLEVSLLADGRMQLSCGGPHNRDEVKIVGSADQMLKVARDIESLATKGK